MSSAVDIAWPEAGADADLGGRLAALRAAPRAAGDGYRERLAALGGLSDALLGGDPALRSALPAEGLAFLSAFLRSDNLAALIARETPVAEALERFAPIGPRKSLRLVPRGLVCHWVAGNVPLLAVFSWALSVALGNRNVLRMSSRQGDVMSPLLRALAAGSEAGRVIAGETLVVSFAREAAPAHEAMSRAADARIAWGGRDAVDAIRDLPADWDCEDIVFGPRMSMAVVDPDVIGDAAVTRLATDAVIFDQLACSSPQRVFVRGAPGEAAFDDFVARFGAAFARQAAAYPRHPLDFAETFRISLDRARAILEGAHVERDAATQWTVAVVERPSDAIECANRFVQVVPFADVHEVCPHIPRNIQTCVTQLAPADAETFTEAAAWRGVCRFPGPGEGNHFENPWDGVGLVSRLTRSVTRSEARASR